MVDTLTAKSAIAAVWVQYCAQLLEGNASRLAELFTEDAQMMQPNMADIVGRPAILALFQQLGAHDSARMQSVELAVTGKSAYEFGQYQSVHSDPEPIEYRGRLAVAWRQDDDGEWRIRRMMLTPISANPIEP